MPQHALAPLLAPESVALVGATEREGALGRLVWQNLAAGGLQGALSAVNPKHKQVFGQRCYARLKDLPETPELAVIVTPARSVPGILGEAGAAGVGAAVVLSSGFGESGDAGRALQAQALAAARKHGLRLLGPNCLGLMRTDAGLNATFSPVPALPGKLALLSQSGAICTALLDWAHAAGVGFSSVVSLGAAADVDFGELLDFLVADPATDAVLMYVEGIHDARRFISALRRCGTVRVKTYTQLFAAARILAVGRMPDGERLAIVTNGGGPGVMAADCATDNGVPLAHLSAESIALLDRNLPPQWSRRNPVDIIGDAPPQRFADATATVLADPGVDALLVMYSPVAVTPPEAAARAVADASRGSGKPVITAWLGDLRAGRTRGMFAEPGLANFYTPENAVEAFSFLCAYRRNQAQLLEVPNALRSSRVQEQPDFGAVNTVRERALAEKRAILTEQESKAVLAAFGLPVPRTIIAADRAAALAAAGDIGYPVALKIHSPDITHKTDVGGVRLNLQNAAMVASAFDDMIHHVRALRPEARIEGAAVQPMLRFANSREVLVGVATDPVFGPVISFGAGGVAVEALRDTAVALPPLNAALAGELMQRTRIAGLLAAHRDIPAADVAALVAVLEGVSRMVCALPWLKEMDLNPVIAHAAGAVIADARIVMHTAPLEAAPRYGHMAIHPYPVELEGELTLRDGSKVALRPIRPEDAELECRFVAGLSERSKYQRFLNQMAELPPQLLARFTQLDYDRELALVALAPGAKEFIGVGRYAPNADGETAEFALAVADAWQGKGIGRALLERLCDCARAAGYKTLVGHILHANQDMRELADRLGFAHTGRDGELVTVERTLR